MMAHLKKKNYDFEGHRRSHKALLSFIYSLFSTFICFRVQEYSAEHETDFQKKEMNGTYIGVKIENFWKYLGSNIKENFF